MSGSSAGGRLMCLMVMMMRRERTERNDGVAEAEREEDGLPDGRAGGGVLTRARGRMSQQAATDERSPTVGGPPTMNPPSLPLSPSLSCSFDPPCSLLRQVSAAAAAAAAAAARDSVMGTVERTRHAEYRRASHFPTVTDRPLSPSSLCLSSADPRKYLR